MHEVLVWIIGIPFGFFLVVLLLINAHAGLLLYALVMPAFQPLTRMTMAIPGSSATIALGGPLQTIILLAGIWMAVSSKARLSKMPAVKVFLALWLVMGISIIVAPGNAGLRIGWLTQFMPRKTDYVAAIKEWEQDRQLHFYLYTCGTYLIWRERHNPIRKSSAVVPADSIGSEYISDCLPRRLRARYSMVGKLQQDHGHFRQPGRIGFVSHLSFAPMYYNGHGQKNEAATPVVFCILRCIIVYLFVSHLYKIIMVRHNGGYYGYWPEEK